MERQPTLDPYHQLNANDDWYVLNSHQMGNSSLRVLVMHRCEGVTGPQEGGSR